MYNNDEKKPINITTYGGNYSNGDAKEKLQIDYTNKLMTVKIMPMGSDFRGDEKNGDKITFSAATASMFLDELIDAKESFKKGESFCNMITCGIQTNNAIEISDGTNIGRPYGMYVVIYVDIQQNKKTDRAFVYTIKSGTVIKGYNHKTGEGTAHHKPFREINDIIYNFEEFVKTSNRAAAHALKDADKYRTSQLANATRIAGKTGTSMYNKGNSNNKSAAAANDIFEYTYDYTDALSDVLTMDYEQ